MQVRGRKQDVLQVNNRLLDLWDLGDIAAMTGFGRYWAAGPYKGGVKLLVEREQDGDAVTAQVIKTVRDRYGAAIIVKAVPQGSLHDRQELLMVREVGKPRYIYSEKEMMKRCYAKAMRI
jgi:hypothetical protein